MGDPDATDQQRHRAFVEYITRQPIAFVHMQLAAIGRGNPGRILAAMLEHGQPVVQLRGDFALADDPDNSAHK